jgi:hypothetical protein
MKHSKFGCSTQRVRPLADRSRKSGQILAVVIIFVAIILGGLWWLYSTKSTAEKEARAFGREMIRRLTVNHDLAFFAAYLSPQARLDIAPMQQQELIAQLQQLGQPAEPIPIDEQITWQSHFFEPRAFFTAHLNYPNGPATLQLAIDHPVSRWQVVSLSFSPPRMR